MKAILVGAGGLSRQILRRLGDRWVVSLVDPVREQLDRVQQIRPVRAVEGDGSSRVVLKRAGLEQADAVVAATGDDETNLEACRLAREAGIQRLVAVANDPDRLSEYRELEVDAISPHALAARRIELNLETRRVSSVAFADGRAEAIEFLIARDSPVCGKALRDLRASSWIIGAILRDNRLVIPHGETELEEGDRVTVVGDGADFAEIVKTFTSGEGRFPLDFGKRVALAVDSPLDLNGTLSEASYLVRSSRASSLLVVHRDPDSFGEEGQAIELTDALGKIPELCEGVASRLRAVDGRPTRALLTVPGGESVGVIVLRAPRAGGTGAWRVTNRAAALVRRTGRPVLLARGSQPYRRIGVPAQRTPAGRAAARVGIDLARFGKSELVGAAVVDPIFIAGPGAPLEARRAISWLEEEAGVHGVSVRGIIRRGNPVRTLREISNECDLLVLGIHARRRRISFRVAGVSELIARGSNRSVLLVPV